MATLSYLHPNWSQVAQILDELNVTQSLIDIIKDYTHQDIFFQSQPTTAKWQPKHEYWSTLLAATDPDPRIVKILCYISRPLSELNIAFNATRIFVRYREYIAVYNLDSGARGTNLKYSRLDAKGKLASTVRLFPICASNKFLYISCLYRKLIYVVAIPEDEDSEVYTEIGVIPLPETLPEVCSMTVRGEELYLVNNTDKITVLHHSGAMIGTLTTPDLTIKIFIDKDRLYAGAGIYAFQTVGCFEPLT